MTPILGALLPVLLAQGPVCGTGPLQVTPEQALFTGCFIPSGRMDGSGAQVFIDPLAPNGYRAKPIPPRQGWGLDPINNY
jgi:hypothetical protein